MVVQTRNCKKQMSKLVHIQIDPTYLAAAFFRTQLAFSVNLFIDKEYLISGQVLHKKSPRPLFFPCLMFQRSCPAHRRVTKNIAAHKISSNLAHWFKSYAIFRNVRNCKLMTITFEPVFQIG